MPLTDLLREIGARLKEARARRGLTQEQVAEGAHVSVETISRLERGVESNPTLNLLRDVSQTVGIGLHELFLPDNDYDRIARERLSRQIAAALSNVGRKDLTSVKAIMGHVVDLIARRH
ncbi:MAG: helix-turn-helix transcriptional regulator [Nitrospirae bacterium]|nr:helix-turn-helix transcriptional regulator [Nitrospirota bacterium]